MITKSSQSLLAVSWLFLCGAFSLAVPSTGELVIKGSSVQAPLALGALSVLHNKDGFSVVKDGATSSVQTHCLDKSLRGISQSNLKSLLDSNGYLRVTQAENGEYLLDAQARLQGGGLICGAIAAVGIRVLGYGGVIAWNLFAQNKAAELGMDTVKTSKDAFFLSAAAVGAIEAAANKATTAASVPWLP